MRPAIAYPMLVQRQNLVDGLATCVAHRVQQLWCQCVHDHHKSVAVEQISRLFYLIWLCPFEPFDAGILREVVALLLERLRVAVAPAQLVQGYRTCLRVSVASRARLFLRWL